MRLRISVTKTPTVSSWPLRRGVKQRTYVMWLNLISLTAFFHTGTSKLPEYFWTVLLFLFSRQQTRELSLKAACCRYLGTSPRRPLLQRSRRKKRLKMRTIRYDTSHVMCNTASWGDISNIGPCTNQEKRWMYSITSDPQRGNFWKF